MLDILFMKIQKKRNIKWNLSSCLTEKLNGFYKKPNFLLIDRIYKPVKHQKMKINCDFSTYKHLAHRSTYNDTNKTRHRYAWQCH